MNKKPLPNLFIIGAAKAGTTTLNSILKNHPEVFMANKKSSNYFSKDSDYKKGLDWYSSKHFSNSEMFSVRGESTPSYLAQAERTAPRIQESLAGNSIKFIIIFRNPAERAYSHYWYNLTKISGQEDSETFSIAFKKDLDSTVKKVKPNPRTSKTLNYYQNGQYSRWIKEYFKYFDSNQFLFLLTEDIFPEKYQNTLQDISKFLKINYIPIEYKRENNARKFVDARNKKWLIKNRKYINKILKIPNLRISKNLRRKFIVFITEPGNYPKMEKETKKEITKIYLDEINELEAIINRDLSHWKM